MGVIDELMTDLDNLKIRYNGLNTRMNLTTALLQQNISLLNLMMQKSGIEISQEEVHDEYQRLQHEVSRKKEARQAQPDDGKAATEGLPVQP